MSQDLKKLAEELQFAVEDAVIGEAMGPGLAGRARSAAMAVLHRHRVRGGRVNVQPQGAGLRVEVVVPPGPSRVRAVVIRFGVG